MSQQSGPGVSGPQAEYQKNASAYLDKLREIFGPYKMRAMKFRDIQSGLKVLDVGCGTGEDAMAMARIVGPTGAVVGLDNNPKMIEEAGRRAQAAGIPVKFVQGEAGRMEFEAESFDRCCADRLLQHVAQPPIVLAEMIRVTKRGGWVVVMDADWETLVVDSAYKRLTRAILNFWCDQQASGWIGRQLYGLFRRSGLQKVEFIADSVCCTQWDLTNFMWGLELFAGRAAQAGAITAVEAAQWVADLRERDRAGAFFASATGFGVRGQKI